MRFKSITRPLAALGFSLLFLLALLARPALAQFGQRQLNPRAPSAS
jgi:hypothetical protein